MNNKIFLFLYSFAHQSALLDKLIVFFAKDFPYIVALFAVIYLIFHHERGSKWKASLFVLFSVALASFASQMLKIIIHADRPFLKLPNIHSLFSETGFAFPSGHATFFSALAFAIFFHHRKAGYWFMLFAVIIGIARVVAGVHFPLDILGGFAIGALIPYLLRSL